jgi:hypothetical protein
MVGREGEGHVSLLPRRRVSRRSDHG